MDEYQNQSLERSKRMDKESNGTYIYHISTNPKHQKGDLFSMDEQAIGFSIQGQVSIVTGMNDSLAATIAAIKKSELVYMAGDVDATTLFELGIAISLGKTVYYVAEQAENKVAALLPYDVEQLKYISFQQFMDIMAAYM